MAGGGIDRYYRSLADRLGWDRQPADPAVPHPATRPQPPPPPPVASPTRPPGASRGATVPALRHCWVVDHPLVPGRRAGLLLEWSRRPQGWSGRVVVALPGEQGPVVLTLWVPAEHLRPA